MRLVKLGTYRSARAGWIIISALVFALIATIALVGLFSFLNASQRLIYRSADYHRAYYGAKAGIHYGVSVIRSLPEIPTDCRIFLSLEDASGEAGNSVTLRLSDDLTVSVKLEAVSEEENAKQPNQWVLTSSAKYKGAMLNTTPVSAQCSVFIQAESFSRYEDFAHDFQDLRDEHRFSFYGAEATIDGPVHYNYGFTTVGDVFFKSRVSYYSPRHDFSLDALEPLGTFDFGAVKRDTNVFSYNDNSASFSGGIYKTIKPIQLPTLENGDRSCVKLLGAKGFLTLPDDDNLYVAQRGCVPQYSLRLIEGIDDDVNGYLVFQQYLGKDADKLEPVFSPSTTVRIDEIANLVVVNGDIVSLKGVLDGELTIVAKAIDGQPSSGGSVFITGSIVYESKGVSSWDSSQPENLNDMLGIVAQRNVLIAQKNLYGELVGEGESVLSIDGFIISAGTRGGSVDGVPDGYFGAENYETRKVGYLDFFGGRACRSIGMFYKSDEQGDRVSGLLPTVAWDNRGFLSPPPYFPTTGELIFVLR